MVWYNGGMTYVVQQPGSNTNPTAYYRIVVFDEWLQHLNHGFPLRVVEQHDLYPTAYAACEALNAAMTAREAIVICPVCTYGEPMEHTCSPEQQRKYSELMESNRE